LESWNVLLNAAKEREYEELLQISKTVKVGEYPTLCYHKKCRRTFVNYTKETSNEPSNRSSLRGPRPATSSGILPNVCIFCNGQKYLAKQNSREKLLSCCQLRADEKVRKAAMEKNDSNVLAITSDDIIAKEASYHASCYKTYTRICYKSKSNQRNDDDSAVEDPASDRVRQFLDDLVNSPDVIKFTDVVAVYEDELQKNGVDQSYITSLKNNLKRKICAERNDINFLTASNNKNLLCYPNTLSMASLVKRFYLIRNELSAIKEASESKQMMVKAAETLRIEIGNLRDEMPWPPTPNDLSVDNFVAPALLRTFLQSLLTGKFTGKGSTRVRRLTASFYQSEAINCFIFSRYGLCSISWKG